MSDLNKIMVVPIKLQPHPNADSLSIVMIDFYCVCVRTEDWQNEDRGAYIPPDNVVDVTRPEFRFLDAGIVGRTTHRVKTKKLRGVMSQGLLVPIPKTVREDTSAVYMFNIGDDVTEYFGVTRYVSLEDLKLDGGEQTSGPPSPGPHYDIESWFKYKDLFPEGTQVVLTEKLHGTNARFTFQNGQMHVGSRSFYRKEGDNIYWRALKENSWIEEFCRNNEGVVLYGEIFGWVQSLKYEAKPGQLFFRAFDVFDPTHPNGAQYWDWGTFWDRITHFGDYLERIVPIIYEGPVSEQLILNFMNGDSTLAKHMREGIIIKPQNEIISTRIGRVILKAVSPDYLEKA